MRSLGFEGRIGVCLEDDDDDENAVTY